MRACLSRTRGGPVLAAAIAATLAGCGGHAAATSSRATTGGRVTRQTTAVTSTGPARRHRAVHPAVTVHGPRIGTTQSVRAFGSLLHVTVTGIVPVPRHDASPPPGDRGIAVRLRIADEAGQTYDSTASGDVSMIVSAGLSAPLDIRAGACETQLVDFESHLYSGDVRTGCVGFSVPRHARVLGVRFSPHARPHGQVTWKAAG